jgi:GNAT superfamily N-acetyltransferase
MDAELSIDRVTEQNFDDFLFLINKLAEYEKLTPPDVAAIARLRNDGLSEQPKYEAYLAILDGKAIGYLIFFMTYSSFLALPTLYIEDIFVLETHRRTGIGEKLFEFCKELAQQHGCGRIEFCVLTWNEPAIQFYEKHGAVRLGWYFYRLDQKTFQK